MTEKRILVTRSSMPPLEEYVEEIRPLWESRWLTNMGEKHRRLEAELRERLGVPGVALFTNGHAALECAFEALGLGKDGRTEVITTPYTFASTANALVRKGLTPVFADIRPDDYTLDPASVEALITPRTCAIVPVHVYGTLCDVDAIRRIAEAHGLKVVYDAAHAFGVERDGVSAAAFGDVSMLSFHATKVFNTIEGGALCFRDESLYPVLNRWKNFGIGASGGSECAGGNAKMNEFCAAMGLCNLRHVDEEIAKRKTVVDRYTERLHGVPGLQLNAPQRGVKPNYAYFPVVFDEKTFGASRNEVFDALAQNGIGARKYFYPLTNTFACFHNRYDVDKTPVARQIAERVLTLPLYADLPLADVDRICDVVLALRR